MKWDVLNVFGKGKIGFGTAIMLFFLPVSVGLDCDLF
jgi:hypothetical protein